MDPTTGAYKNYGTEYCGYLSHPLSSSASYLFAPFDVRIELERSSDAFCLAQEDPLSKKFHIKIKDLSLYALQGKMLEPLYRSLQLKWKERGDKYTIYFTKLQCRGHQLSEKTENARIGSLFQGLNNGAKKVYAGVIGKG